MNKEILNILNTLDDLALNNFNQEDEETQELIKQLGLLRQELYKQDCEQLHKQFKQALRL